MPTADVLNIQVKLTGVQIATRQLDELHRKMAQGPRRGAGGAGGGGRGGSGGGGGGGGRGFWYGDALQATGILLRGAEQIGRVMVDGAKSAVKAYESFAAFKMGAQTLLGPDAGKKFAADFQKFAIPAIYNTESLRNAGLQMAGSLGGDRAIETLKSVSDILAATGVMDREKADSVFLALQQTAGKGRLTGEEFTRQLSNAAPAFAQLLIKEAGGLDKLIPGGGKPGMSSDKLFAMINKIANEGGFAGSQERLASQSPSLRWGQIMDLMESKLIPVGEKFAEGVMSGLNALEQGVNGINWEQLAVTAKKWGEEVGKFIKFLVAKIPQFEKWINNLDLAGIAETGKKVVNALGTVADFISGKEGLIVGFLALTAAARGVAAVFGSFKLIIGETVGWVLKLVKGAGGIPGVGGGGGSGGLVGGIIPGIGKKAGGIGQALKRLIGSRAVQVGASAATSYLPALPGSIAASGATAGGSGLAGLLTGAVTGTIASVAVAVVASAAVAAVTYKLTSMALDAIAGGDYNDLLRRKNAIANGATIDADGNEIYGGSSPGQGFFERSRQRASRAGGSGEREMARREQAAREDAAAQIGISPENYRARIAERNRTNRPVRLDDMRRVMGRSQYDTLRRV